MAKLAANIIIESRKHLDDDDKIYSAISLVLHLILVASIGLSGLYIARQEALKPKIYRVSIATLPTSGNQGLKNRKLSKPSTTSISNPKPKKVENSVKKKVIKAKTTKKKTETKKAVGLNTKKNKPKKKKVTEESAFVKNNNTKSSDKKQKSSSKSNEKVGFSKEVSSAFDLGSVNFEYSYYLSILKDKIGSNWIRNYIGEGKVKIYFQILKTGEIKSALIEESSGNTGLDKLALRAVLNSSPLPPLPEGYVHDKLGIHLWFNYEE